MSGAFDEKSGLKNELRIDTTYPLWLGGTRLDAACKEHVGHGRTTHGRTRMTTIRGTHHIRGKRANGRHSKAIGRWGEGHCSGCVVVAVEGGGNNLVVLGRLA